MASVLLPECLEKIFLNLFDYSNPTFSEFVSDKKTCDYKIKDLHTCTLVSRYWCQVSTPLLYSYPFQLFRHLNYKKPKPSKSSKSSKSEIGKDIQDYYKLIRTLLICIPQSEIEEIVNSTCAKESSTPITYPQQVSPVFNYVTFLRELHFDDKFFADDGKQIWMPSYIPANSNPEVCHSIINHLVEYLCKHCNNLTKLEFLCEELQIDLMDLLSENKVNGLKELYCTGKHNLTKLYTTLSTTTSYLELFHNNKIMSLEQGNALSSLISAQRKLKHIILSEDRRSFLNTNISGWYNVVFNSLSTQKEWLEKLEFIDVSFDHLDQEALNSLCSLKNLKELKLERCRFSNCIVDFLRLWGKSLSNLRVLEYKDFSPSNFATDFELITIIVQTSSSTLTKLVLDYTRSHDHGFRLLKDVLTCLPIITHLKLPGLFPHELTTLFKSCTELVYLSTTLSYAQWDESLRSIGRLVPNSIQKIQFREMQSVAMNSETLKYFLESCINKGGKLKCLEIIGKCELDQEHFDVAKQLGVQLIKL